MWPLSGYPGVRVFAPRKGYDNNIIGVRPTGGIHGLALTRRRRWVVGLRARKLAER